MNATELIKKLGAVDDNLVITNVKGEYLFWDKSFELLLCKSDKPHYVKELIDYVSNSSGLCIIKDTCYSTVVNFIIDDTCKLLSTKDVSADDYLDEYIDRIALEGKDLSEAYIQFGSDGWVLEDLRDCYHWDKACKLNERHNWSNKIIDKLNREAL